MPNPLKIAAQPKPNLSPSPANVEESMLNIAVQAPLSLIREAIVNHLPNPVFEGFTSIKVPIFNKEMDAIIAYRGELLSLDLKLSGNQALVQPVLEFSISVSLDTQGKTLDLVSLGGNNEDRPRVQLDLLTELDWADNGRLMFMNRRWSLVWLRTGQIAGANLDVAEIIDVPVFREKLEQFIDDILQSERYNDFSINFLLEKQWTLINEPINIRKDVWLYVNPEALFISAVHGDEKHLYSTVGVRCKPELIIGQRQERESKPFPASTPDGVGEGFHAAVLGNIAYKDAEVLLFDKLRESQLGYKGFNVTVDDVKVVGNQNKVVIVLTISSPIQGKVMFRGLPKYDIQTNTVYFEQLNFTLQTEKWWANAADFLFHDRIKDYLATRLRFSLAQTMADLLAQLRLFDIDLSDDPPVKLYGKTDNLRLISITLSDDALNILLKGSGSAGLSIS